jgi:hypothetical protein
VDLRQVLCIREKRVVRNDGTIVHDKTIYQVLESIRPPYVFVEERLNGRLYLTYRDESLRYRKLVSAPVRSPSKTPAPRKTIGTSYTPSRNHPWKRTPVVLGQPIPQPPKTGHF